MSFADLSRGTAHLIQLNHALSTGSTPWQAALRQAHKKHCDTAACARILEALRARDDWALEVLRLRGSALSGEHQPISPALPIARHALRMAYCAVAKEVHPDRLSIDSLAHQAMSALNEAYRQATVRFSERPDNEVILLDQLGIAH